MNSTITTHVLLAVVRRDDQRLESQLRQSRGARYRERMGYDDAAQNSIVGRSMGISANGPQLSALGKGSWEPAIFVRFTRSEVNRIVCSHSYSTAVSKGACADDPMRLEDSSTSKCCYCQFSFEIRKARAKGFRMRKGILSLIGVFSATTTFAQSVTHQGQHASLPLPAIRPDKLGYPISGVEWISREFAFLTYNLSLQLANILGPWSRTELFLHITIAKVILGLLAALIVLGVRLVARHFLNQHADHPKAEGSKRYWLGGIRFAIKKGLSIFFFVTAALIFVSPLLPHVVFATNSESPFQAVSTLAQLGYLAALLVFCFHIVRLIVNWLDARSLRAPRKWFYPAFPLLGRLLYYNLIIISFHSAIVVLNLAEPTQAIASKAVSITIALINSIFVIQMIRAVEDMAVVGTESRIADTYKMRGLKTRLRLLRQLLIFIVVLICLGAILANIDAVRQVGGGLLASAGVAGVIVGFAAQKSLATIIAGLQVAFSSPIKIGDVIIVESEYGTIEEITLTYVVVKVWDLRRIILPITYFLEKPFENWTRNSSELLGTVFLYVDYVTSVEAIRTKGEEIVAASPLWDKRVFAVQITDWKANAVEVRILVSAHSAPQLFDLRCLVREKMLAFMQEQNQVSFPQVRYLNSQLPSSRSDSEAEWNGNLQYGGQKQVG